MQSRRNTLLCHYRYDALDRLIANEQPSAPERQRFYCKSRLATEIQGVNRYSLLQHGDQILAQQQSEGDALSTTLLATDQQRSVLQTLNANQTRRPIAYTPYGHHRPENGLLSLLGFNGERPDPVTGCYLLGNGYRAFNPVLMRFNCPDSWSPFREGGLNPYTYCLGDPINHYDQNGHSPILKSLIQFIEKSVNGTSNSRRLTTIKPSAASAPPKPNQSIWNQLDALLDQAVTEVNLNLKELEVLQAPARPGQVSTLQKLSADAIPHAALQQHNSSFDMPRPGLSQEFRNAAVAAVAALPGPRPLVPNKIRETIDITFLAATNGEVRGVNPHRITQP